MFGGCKVLQSAANCSADALDLNIIECGHIDIVDIIIKRPSNKFKLMTQADTRRKRNHQTLRKNCFSNLLKEIEENIFLSFIDPRLQINVTKSQPLVIRVASVIYFRRIPSESFSYRRKSPRIAFIAIES